MSIYYIGHSRARTATRKNQCNPPFRKRVIPQYPFTHQRRSLPFINRRRHQSPELLNTNGVDIRDRTRRENTHGDATCFETRLECTVSSRVGLYGFWEGDGWEFYGVGYGVVGFAWWFK